MDRVSNPGDHVEPPVENLNAGLVGAGELTKEVVLITFGAGVVAGADAGFPTMASVA